MIQNIILVVCGGVGETVDGRFEIFWKSLLGKINWISNFWYLRNVALLAASWGP